MFSHFGNLACDDCDSKYHVRCWTFYSCLIGVIRAVTITQFKPNFNHHAAPPRRTETRFALYTIVVASIKVTSQGSV